MSATPRTDKETLDTLGGGPGNGAGERVHVTQAIEQARSNEVLDGEPVTEENPALEFLRAKAPADVLAMIDPAK